MATSVTLPDKQWIRAEPGELEEPKLPPKPDFSEPPEIERTRPPQPDDPPQPPQSEGEEPEPPEWVNKKIVYDWEPGDQVIVISTKQKGKVVKVILPDQPVKFQMAGPERADTYVPAKIVIELEDGTTVTVSAENVAPDVPKGEDQPPQGEIPIEGPPEVPEDDEPSGEEGGGGTGGEAGEEESDEPVGPPPEPGAGEPGGEPDPSTEPVNEPQPPEGEIASGGGEAGDPDEEPGEGGAGGEPDEDEEGEEGEPGESGTGAGEDQEDEEGQEQGQTAQTEPGEGGEPGDDEGEEEEGDRPGEEPGEGTGTPADGPEPDSGPPSPEDEFEPPEQPETGPEGESEAGSGEGDETGTSGPQIAGEATEPGSIDDYIEKLKAEADKMAAQENNHHDTGIEGDEEDHDEVQDGDDAMKEIDDSINREVQQTIEKGLSDEELKRKISKWTGGLSSEEIQATFKGKIERSKQLGGWKKVLRSAILQATGVTESWAGHVQSRRDPDNMLGARVNAPAIERIIISMDCSASMGTKTFLLCLKELQSIFSLNKVKSAVQDAQMYLVAWGSSSLREGFEFTRFPARRAKTMIMSKFPSMSNSVMSRAGGTHFGPSVEKMMKKAGPCDLLIIMTDGEFFQDQNRISERAKSYLRRHKHKLLWVFPYAPDKDNMVPDYDPGWKKRYIKLR